MKCPFCNHTNLKVVYTMNVFGTSKFRRRMCTKCKRTFPTLEKPIQEKDSMDTFKDVTSHIKPNLDKIRKRRWIR